VSVYLYVEGGAKGSLARECRKGFSQFLSKAGCKGRMPKVFACGSRREAYEDYCTAVKAGKKAILLVDSEMPVEISADKAKPWEHVKNRQGDGWAKPATVTDDHLHFMVICMESWFLADKDALASYFGQYFNINALPKRSDVENVSKADVYNALFQATKDSQKGEYGKGKHSFKILGLINPEKVKSASPYAKRFLNTLSGL